jgi:SRSO17 transposase
MDTIPLAPPKASPTPLPELAAFLAPFAPLFQRAQSRQSLERYVTGLLTDLPRKNCDTIAAAVAGSSTERLQHLLTDALWDPLLLDEQRVRQLVARSPRHGILALDDTGLPKQGKASPGVARQYSGTLGKVGNCQIVVTAEYSEDAPASSTPCHWPVSAAVYLPAAWASDGERRTRAAIPEDVGFATKIDLALGLIDQALSWAVPFTAVTADAGYGSNPHFLEGLETRHLPYVVAVEKSFGLREPAAVREAAAVPPPRYAGRGRPRKQPPAPLATAESVATLLAADAWQTLMWREGTKGGLRKQFAAVRVHRATGSAATTNPERITTGPEGWLLLERPLPGEDGDTSYYYSNFPADTPLLRLVHIAHARWVIEQFYEDAKGECGLDDYQGRRWDGLQRHLALAMLAYSFLAFQRSAVVAPERALSPLRTAPVAAGGPPPDPRLAVPRTRAVAHRHRPDQDLPPLAELTK